MAAWQRWAELRGDRREVADQVQALFVRGAFIGARQNVSETAGIHEYIDRYIEGPDEIKATALYWVASHADDEVGLAAAEMLVRLGVDPRVGDEVCYLLLAPFPWGSPSHPARSLSFPLFFDPLSICVVRRDACGTRASVRQ